MSEENNTVKLPAPGSLIVSSSPHLHENSSISKIMLQVLLCLLPAVLAAIWFFGLPALKVMVYCVAFCMLFEYLWCRLMKQKSTLRDYSAALAFVANTTAAPIAKAKEAKVFNGLKTVLPAFDNDLVKTKKTYKSANGANVDIYTAKKNGKVVGYAAQAFVTTGYGGRVEGLIGLSH